jgi:hypothetical protein
MFQGLERFDKNWFAIFRIDFTVSGKWLLADANKIILRPGVVGFVM